MNDRKRQVTQKKRAEADGVPVFCAFDKIVLSEDLTVHPRNPNEHPPEQLRLYLKIIQMNGWRRAVVVSTRSGFITKGNGAAMAAKLGALKSLPVNYQDYDSDEAELEDMIADNELARLAKAQKADLQKLLLELSHKGRDPELAGILAKLDEQADGAPIYPITSKLNEAYDYVLIFTGNASDFVFLQNLCGVQTETSYKKTGIGVGRCVPFSRFLQAIRENHHSLHVQGGHDDNPPPADKLPGRRSRKPKGRLPKNHAPRPHASGPGEGPHAEAQLAPAAL